MASGAVTSVLQKLGGLACQEVAMLCGVEDQIVFLRDQFEWLQAFLHDAEQKRRDKKNKLIRVWVNQIRDVANFTEDVLDDFTFKLDNKGMGCTGWKARIKRFSPTQLLYRHKIADRINKIQLRLQGIAANKFHLLLPGDASSSASSSSAVTGMSEQTIYIGYLPGDIREREVADLFRKYGPIVDIDLKIPSRPPCYAFVEFEDPRDAEDAVHGRDGYDFDGYRLKVELAHGGGQCGGVSICNEYRVLVTGLPSSASQQDLKDHMCQAGDVCFSEVFSENGGTLGIVVYTNCDDMEYAIRELDDSEFRNAVSRAYIRVREYESSRSPSRSPSHCSSYSRSPSPVHGRSRNRSKSPSVKSSSRSLSRSHSRSTSSDSCSGSKQSSLSRMSRTIHVGCLSGDIREREVEDLFYKYGPIADVYLMKIPSRPICYAFVEFEDPRDAEAAVHGCDGYDFDGYRLKVEQLRGGGRRGGVSTRTEYRVLVTGLPSSASQQDLKDHMDLDGDNCFSEVFHENGDTLGIVGYTNYDDMEYAIRELDDSEFINAVSRAYIRVREYGSSRSPSGSPSHRSSHSRSPTPVGRRSCSRRKSKGKSLHRSLSRSQSRSASCYGSSSRRRSFTRR